MSKRRGTKKRAKSQELQVSTKLQVISFYIKVMNCKVTNEIKIHCHTYHGNIIQTHSERTDVERQIRTKTATILDKRL